MTATVETLLADPEFDVEQFIHNINLHEAKPKIIEVLTSDPRIMLSIAEGPNWKLLERHPCNPDEFIKLKDLGLETWTKKTGKDNNVWYGIIASPELALSFRRVLWSPELTVLRGSAAADNARARWKQLKMYKFGEQKATKQPIEPGKRPIDLIRHHFKFMMSKFNLRNYNWTSKVTQPCFRYRVGNYNTGFSVDCEITTSGPYIMRVTVKDPVIINEWANIKIPLLVDPKIKTVFKEPEVAAKEAFECIKEHNKYFKEFVETGKPVKIPYE